MAAPIRLREDYRAKDLRVLARESRDANHTRRLLSLAEIYDGGTRTQAARIGGVGLQVIQDWVLRSYNLGNFLRTLALPQEIEHWSLTTLREKLVKIGAKVVRHGRYVTFQLAEVAVPRELFRKILRPR